MMSLQTQHLLNLLILQLPFSEDLLSLQFLAELLQQQLLYLEDLRIQLLLNLQETCSQPLHPPCLEAQPPQTRPQFLLEILLRVPNLLEYFPRAVKKKVPAVNQLLEPPFWKDHRQWR